MTRVFYVPLRNLQVERTSNKSQHTKLTLEKKILPLLLLVRDSKSQPFDHESGALNDKLSRHTVKLFFFILKLLIF